MIRSLSRLATVLALVALVSLAAAPPIAAQDWAGTGRIQGQVVDNDKKPIEGATVEIFLGAEGRGPEPVLTKKNGRWAVLGLSYGLWTIRITKDGYVPSEGTLQVGSSTRGAMVNTLHEIPESARVDERKAAAKQMLESGSELLEAGQYAAARAEFESAMANLEAEFHPMILREIARSHSLEGQAATDPEARAASVSAAIETLKKLVAADPENSAALKMLSDILLAEGRQEEAREYAARLPEDMKLDPNALANIGIDLYNQGKLDEAAEHFGGIIADYPDYALAYYYRGVASLGLLGSLTDEEEIERLRSQAQGDLEKFIATTEDVDKVEEAKSFLEYLASG